jgi:hypothetical protein
VSCYEWEAGNIKLPSAVFSKFRRDLNTYCNQRQTNLFNKALQVFEKMVVQIKSKPSADLEHDILEHLKESKYNAFRMGWNTLDCDGADEILRVLLPPGNKLHRPQKKDFPVASITRDRVSDGEWGISFTPKEHAVHWSVAENNHACERAHEHAVVEHFFGMLNAVQWVRGSGGVIAGNNEYNRESEYAGGGGNLTIFTFGPKTQSSAPPAMARRPPLMRRSVW